MREKTVVVINGTGSSGKDTVDRIVSSYCRTYRIDSVEIPKTILRSPLVGWDGVKTPEARRALHEIKQTLIKFNDCVFRVMSSRVDVFMSDNFDGRVFKYAFVHIREIEEIERMVSYCKSMGYPVKTCLVYGRHDYSWGNSSDDCKLNFDPSYYDIVLNNDGDEEHLTEQVLRGFNLR